MEFAQPPDSKITPKPDYYSSLESLLLSSQERRIEADEMAFKSTDRVPRKLEFTSSGTSMLNYENIEPLKVPDLAITKKKDISRDNSREKENRSKRIKKDDCKSSKDELHQDMSRWPKSQQKRHVSRKEIADSIINRKLRNDRVLAHHGHKESSSSEVILKKSKNFVTSTVKKDEEKRHRYSNLVSSSTTTARTKKDRSLDSKNRTSSSDSIYPTDKGTRLHDKILIREGYKAMISEINDRRYKDDSQIHSSSKPSDDPKQQQQHKSHSETRLPKYQNKSKPIELLTRDQSNKRGGGNSDKLKSKANSKLSSEISEDLSTAATSSLVGSAKSQSLGTEVLSSKSKDVDKSSAISDSFSQHVASSSNAALSGTMIETKISQQDSSSLSEMLMDPMRISFSRDDGYANQPEFADLVTPDMNLMLRSKRRKDALRGKESDNEPKLSPLKSSSQDIEEASLVIFLVIFNRIPGDGYEFEVKF